MLQAGVFLIITLITTTGSLYISPQCPQQCICLPNFTDCKNNQLKDLPTGFDNNMTVLDLAYNAFEEFPRGLNKYSNLIYLNMSHNIIQSLTGGTFTNLKKLERLDLTHNAFSDWTDITSNTFSSLTNLNFLDFSHNPLRSLPRDRNPFQIPSLKYLHLVNCSIAYFNNNILSTLPNLQELHLARNPILYLRADFVSSSLKFLDLNGCDLHFVSPTVFKKLTTLETVYMRDNTNLKEFNCDAPSLLYLDLSNCNLEAVPKGNLTNIYAANFHGNHFRTIPKKGFTHYSNLEILDLSYNAISSIDADAFFGLNKIVRIDLSQNTISSVARELFLSNENLEFLNLSRNYFSTVPNLITDSLENLDLSSCEIRSVDSDSLIEMASLKILNLSNNIMSYLPDNWQANNLESLDVSLCRIKTVNNRTFALMPSLRDLNIARNSLTTAAPDSFLQVISLDISDNSWRCDCAVLKPLYTWLSNTGKRMDGLYCQTPEALEGMSWMSACQKEWHPDITKSESVWWYTTGLIAAVFVILFVIIAMRRMYLLKEKRLREADSRRRAEERETLRRQQRVQAEMREEASRNAPDPRELQRPPSYHEALLLPPLDSSHPSLSGSMHSIASKYSLHGSNPDVSKRGRPRRKRRRRKSDSSEGQRASRVVVDSETASDPERPQPRTTLESDF